MFPDLLTATNASDGSVSLSWREGVVSNAYYFVDLTTTNKSIRVTVTPRVPTAQGAYQVQFLAGMTARIPLLRGVTYDFVGNSDDLGFSTFEEDVSVTQTSNRAYAVGRSLSYELGGSMQTDTACASGHVHARHYRITTGVPDIPGTLEFDDTKCFTPVGPNEFVAECDGLKGATCPTNDVITGRFIYEGVTNSFAITNSTLCRCDNLHHPTCPCGANILCNECDTTIYGQDENWVRANIDRLRELDPAVTNAEDILSRGYLNWVNDRVGCGLLNGLYMLTATFEEPPSVPTQLRVGDYVVFVTNAGFYAFLLEKGVDYYFDTYPRVPDVIYSTRDDLAAPPMTTSLETELVGMPGVWTRDGGEKELTAPDGNDPGHSLQMPTLTATPDIAHFGPTDLPVSFTAVLSDFFAMNNVAFLWTSADSNLNIVTPTDVSTAVSATSIPDWEEFQLTVSANVYGHTLESVLMQSYYGFLESRPVYQDVLSLALLTSGGDEIPWSSPVLDGEDMRMRIVLSEPSDDISEFVAKYSGALSLRTYSVDDDGDRLISERIVPLSAGDVELRTSCEFDVLLHAAWLRSAGLVSKAEDAWQEKTSLDMSASVTGLSQRVDSDTIDGLSGLLRGRVRGEGDETSSVPEGVFNDRYLKSAGYVMMVAECGIRVSQPKPVQQQADRVYYSGHGSHASAKLMNKYGPSELATHWEDVDVLVIAGCAVLDIKDYRSSSFNMFAKRKWEKKGGACSPGVQWESMGLDVYLGYAWYAPRDSEGGNVIAARYKANILSGQDCIVAWRNANDCDEGRNACAIDCRTTPHIFWYWEESAFGGCVWTSITKGGVGW